jgi:hypothetical protein
VSSESPTGRGSNRHTEKLVSRFERSLKRSGGALVDRYGEDAAAAMRLEMLDEYRGLIPKVPDIGGRRNIYFRNLEQAPWALAMYRVVVRHGGSLEDAGELIHRMIRAEMERVPRVVRSLMGRYLFTRIRQRKLERAARRSQARQYPGDWVLERVEGDGESFDFGVDMIECGIVKFFHAQGAEELTPYGCDLDYVMFEAMGIGFRRTKTLAWGCDRCDFRISRTGETSAPWPPLFAERTCGELVAEEGNPGS